MKHAFISFLLMMGTIQVQAQDQDFWIFLCYGQSNMAGQAPIEQQDLTVCDPYKRLLDMAKIAAKDGKIIDVTASEPIDKIDVVSFSGKTVKTFIIDGKSEFELPVEELPKEKLIFVFQNANGKTTADIDL